MKTPFFFFLAAFGSALATPEHSVAVNERFFGSNETGYALVRTENDNMCSYYTSKETTWLDEYSKDDSQREKVTSTMLLEVTRSRDASHNDPDTAAPVTEEVNQQDSTLKLADLLKRYPTQVTEGWSAAEIAKLNATPSVGILYRNREFVTSDAIISMVLFGQRHVDEDWHLDSVSGDLNCVFLEISVGQDQNPETRLLCITPQISKRLIDQQSMQAIYLVVGTYHSADEARTRAKALRESARGLKLYNFNPEIWTKREATDKISFVVVERDSSQLIESGRIPQVQSTLGIDFLPMSSEHFIERIALAEPKPTEVE